MLEHGLWSFIEKKVESNPQKSIELNEDIAYKLFCVVEYLRVPKKACH